jgi:hypothetical protein
MKLRLSICLSAALLFLVVFHFGQRRVEAQAPSKIPAAFGHCVGGITQGLIFEAEDGTIRVVNIVNGNLLTFPRH